MSRVQDTTYSSSTHRGLPKLFFPNLPKPPSRLSRLEELTCSARREMCAGVSSFGFGGTNSRADLWADVEKGPFKEPGKHCDVWRQGGGQWGSTANYVMNARVRMNMVPYWRERSMTFLVPDERKGNTNKKWRSCCCSAYPFWAYPVYNNQWGVI